MFIADNAKCGTGREAIDKTERSKMGEGMAIVLALLIVARERQAARNSSKSWTRMPLKNAAAGRLHCKVG